MQRSELGAKSLYDELAESLSEDEDEVDDSNAQKSKAAARKKKRRNKKKKSQPGEEDSAQQQRVAMNGSHKPEADEFNIKLADPISLVINEVVKDGFDPDVVKSCVDEMWRTGLPYDSTAGVIAYIKNKQSGAGDSSNGSTKKDADLASEGKVASGDGKSIGNDGSSPETKGISEDEIQNTGEASPAKVSGSTEKVETASKQQGAPDDEEEAAPAEDAQGVDAAAPAPQPLSQRLLIAASHPTVEAAVGAITSWANVVTSKELETLFSEHTRPLRRLLVNVLAADATRPTAAKSAFLSESNSIRRNLVQLFSNLLAEPLGTASSSSSSSPSPSSSAQGQAQQNEQLRQELALSLLGEMAEITTTLAKLKAEKMAGGEDEGEGEGDGENGGGGGPVLLIADELYDLFRRVRARSSSSKDALALLVCTDSLVDRGDVTLQNANSLPTVGGALGDGSSTGGSGGADGKGQGQGGSMKEVLTNREVYRQQTIAMQKACAGLIAAIKQEEQEESDANAASASATNANSTTTTTTTTSSGSSAGGGNAEKLLACITGLSTTGSNSSNSKNTSGTGARGASGALRSVKAELSSLASALVSLEQQQDAGGANAAVESEIAQCEEEARVFAARRQELVEQLAAVDADLARVNTRKDALSAAYEETNRALMAEKTEKMDQRDRLERVVAAAEAMVGVAGRLEGVKAEVMEAMFTGKRRTKKTDNTTASTGTTAAIGGGGGGGGGGAAFMLGLLKDRLLSQIVKLYYYLSYEEQTLDRLHHRLAASRQKLASTASEIADYERMDMKLLVEDLVNVKTRLAQAVAEDEKAVAAFNRSVQERYQQLVAALAFVSTYLQRQQGSGVGGEWSGVLAGSGSRQYLDGIRGILQRLKAVDHVRWSKEVEEEIKAIRTIDGCSNTTNTTNTSTNNSTATTPATPAALAAPSPSPSVSPQASAALTSASASASVSRSPLPPAPASTSTSSSTSGGVPPLPLPSVSSTSRPRWGAGAAGAAGAGGGTPTSTGGAGAGGGAGGGETSNSGGSLSGGGKSLLEIQAEELRNRLTRENLKRHEQGRKPVRSPMLERILPRLQQQQQQQQQHKPSLPPTAEEEVPGEEAGDSGVSGIEGQSQGGNFTGSGAGSAGFSAGLVGRGGIGGMGGIGGRNASANVLPPPSASEDFGSNLSTRGSEFGGSISISLTNNDDDDDDSIRCSGSGSRSRSGSGGEGEEDKCMDSAVDGVGVGVGGAGKDQEGVGSGVNGDGNDDGDGEDAADQELLLKEEAMPLGKREKKARARDRSRPNDNDRADADADADADATATATSTSTSASVPGDSSAAPAAINDDGVSSSMLINLSKPPLEEEANENDPKTKGFDSWIQSSWPSVDDNNDDNDDNNDDGRGTAETTATNDKNGGNGGNGDNKDDGELNNETTEIADA